MASINFDNFKIDIVVQNIDGIFSRVFGVSFPKGFWVLLTVENNKGEKETFPRIDDEDKIKTYKSYDEAIDDIAELLKIHFKK